MLTDDSASYLIVCVDVAMSLRGKKKWRVKRQTSSAVLFGAISPMFFAIFISLSLFFGSGWASCQCILSNWLINALLNHQSEAVLPVLGLNVQFWTSGGLLISYWGYKMDTFLRNAWFVSHSEGPVQDVGCKDAKRLKWALAQKPLLPFVSLWLLEGCGFFFFCNCSPHRCTEREKWPQSSNVVENKSGNKRCAESIRPLWTI